MDEQPLSIGGSLVQFTKPTRRALVFSAALVASAGSLAGAAVFHLPILGLGGANVASAQSTATTHPPTVVTVPRKVTPKTVIKTRYVNDVVHVRAIEVVHASAANAPIVAPIPERTAPVASPAVAPQPQTFRPNTVGAAPTAPVSYDDGHHAYSEDDHGDAQEHQAHGTVPTAASYDAAVSTPSGDQ